MIRPEEHDRVVLKACMCELFEQTFTFGAGQVASAAIYYGAVEMGASYPDIAQMILQAHQQGSIDGQVEIDALPEGGRMYYRPVEETPLMALKSGSMKSEKPKSKRGARVGNENVVPNIFHSGAPRTKTSKRSEYDVDDEDDNGKATLADFRKEKSSDKEEDDDKFIKQTTFQSLFRYFKK